MERSVMERLVGAMALLVALSMGGTTAWAQADAGAPPMGSGSPRSKLSSSCDEYVPKGATRPTIEASLPERGLSGYAVYLDVKVTHGRGETVMPGGFRIQRGSDAMEVLREAGWVIPEPDAGAGPLIEPGEASDADTVTSTLSLPFVPLPDEPGRHLLALPPIPITVARANGQVMTLCTEPRTITIDDPIANEVDPKVKPNPPPRPQREEWVAAKQAAIVALAAVLLALLLLWLVRRYQRRPKEEPEKPRVLPWVWAMQRLVEIRASRMLDDECYDELIDSVSEVTRDYLGRRYGFDGLESTSDEIRRTLKRVYPPLQNLDDIHRFLDETDLVKFADVPPTREVCELAQQLATSIVAKTTPVNARAIEEGRRRKKRKKKRRKRARKAA